MISLVLKDVRLHWKGFCYGLGFLIGMLLLGRFTPDRSPGLGDVQRYFGLVGLVSLIILSEWLVREEISHRTIIWLRTLPLSDWQIIGSKFFSFSIGHWFLVFAAISMVRPDWLTAYGKEILVYSAVIYAWGGLMLASRLALSPRTGLLLPLGALLVLTVVGATGHLPASAIAWLSGPVAACSVSAGVFVLSYITATLLMSRRETLRWAP